MNIPSSKTRRDLELAAELRVAGCTWDDIAEKLKRHPNLVIRWTSQYRADWEQLLREAEAHAKRQGTNESRHAMRLLLRHKVSKVRIRAVDQLTKLLRAEGIGSHRPDAGEDLGAYLSQVEEMSDDELEETLAEFAEHYRGKLASGSRSHARPDEDDGHGVAGAASAERPD